ncbi:hypothetical protein I4U23_026964 [Adineta vaga]|nr:hypothetical protein I4U23_026964 [Adineta vaga]
MHSFTSVLIFLNCHVSYSFNDDFSTDYCPYLSLLSSSQDTIIYTNSETSKFSITVQSEHNGSRCEIPFNNSIICGISIGKEQNWTKQWFIYWGFDEDLENYFIRTIYYSQLTSHKCQYNFSNQHYLNADSVEFELAYDGLMAYGFDYNSVYFYDLQLDIIHEVQPSTGNLTFTPSDLSLTKNAHQILAIGYLKDGNLSSSLMYATVCLWNVNSTNYSISIMDCHRLHHIGYHFSEYHPGPKLSIEINDYNQSNLTVIGNSANRSIDIYVYDDMNLIHKYKYENNEETNSVCWLRDGHRIAVLAHLTSTAICWFDNPWIWVGLKDRRHGEQYATPCWPGMYKEEDNILPCRICPTQTKSDGNATNCSACHPSSFCPLASVVDINRTDYFVDIQEELTYPKSSDSTEFEDILLTNMFLIGRSSRCILISPLFWMLIVLGIIIVILLFIGIMKFFPQSHRHRTMIKQIFRQADIIGEGEFWIGGLMSFSLLVLLIFAFLFTNEYTNLYPIEQADNPKLICDETIRNSQFDTNLKLLTTRHSSEDQIIFDMLNNQSFTLIVSFINTNFDCSLLTILEGTGHNLHEPISPMQCSQLNISRIIHTSISLSHHVTFQYTIKHFAPIGGLYVCLLGLGNMTDDGSNILRDLTFCKWIQHENQTIGYTPEINLINTKVINRTESLIEGQPMKSTGIWQTTYTGLELSDQLLYDRRGEYHRYLSVNTVLTISLDENQFYVENSQEPISRKGEANFHTVLFMSLALEMFCLIFLVFKLVFVPLFRYIERKILSCTRVKPLINEKTEDNTEMGVINLGHQKKMK